MTEEEKAIERCKELIKEKHSSWIGIANQLAIKTVIKKYENQQSELEKKDKIIKWIKDYAQQEVDFRTEDIKDYINDDKEKNKNIIEEREHWKDIIRIINNEKNLYGVLNNI